MVTSNFEHPLVSIIVVTYNSSKYVLDTLESIRKQDYKNIEIIVSDDGSTDNTVKICEDWIKLNKAEFIACKVITSSTNTGIPSNCNRGAELASGEWIKLIAGDDLLVKSCVSNYIEYAKTSKTKLMFSDMFLLKDDIISEAITEFIIVNFFKLDVKLKYKTYLRSAYFLNTPTIFIHRITLIKFGGFNERFKFLEDMPIILKFLCENEDLGFLKKRTVIRRIHLESLSTSKESISDFRKEFLYNLYEAYRLLRRPYLSSFNILDVYAKATLDMDFRHYKDPNFLAKNLYSLKILYSKIKRVLFKSNSVK